MKLWQLVAIGVLGAFLVRAYVVEGIVIASESMEPALPVGRHLFVNKLAYRFRDPRRGDIVVFPSPVEEKKGLVKRVIAVEGDEVRIVEKKVLLNGQPLEEPYVVHRRAGEKFTDDNMDVGRVPRGSVFVLGDNRDVSGDSRDWKDPKTGEPIRFIRAVDLTGEILDFP
jgi:signal peptidase I